MNTPFLEDLDQIVNRQTETIRSTPGNPRVGTVALFDLADSTRTKRASGHERGVRQMSIHNNLCRELVDRFEGSVIKEIGDAVLAVFERPTEACLASANLLMATRAYTEFSTKGALVMGEFEELEIDGRVDILGDTVDKCARIASFAETGEIVFDEGIHESAISFVQDYGYFSIGSAGNQCVPDFGMTSLYKISLSVPNLYHREAGRRDINEKTDFMADASHEVIQLGIGLTTFAEYFESRRRGQFEQQIRELLSDGVKFRCVMINPESRAAKLYTESTSEPGYLNEIKESARDLVDLKNSFEDEDVPGSFDVFQYDHTPLYHGVAVDKGHPQGKIYVSNYMYGIERRASPGMGFSRYSNPGLFSKYVKSMEYILNISKKI